MLEVEAKFEVRNSEALAQKLNSLGFVVEQELYQADYYFNHPQRDFKTTDEAFRIRVVGDELELTYKGPRLDSQIKTRREVEVPLARRAGSLAAAQDMFVSLGFRPVGSVVKTRRQGSLNWNGISLKIAMDRVDDAGDFIELERVVEEAEQKKATEEILAVARELGLEKPIRQSYLELVSKSRAKA